MRIPIGQASSLRFALNLSFKASRPAHRLIWIGSFSNDDGHGNEDVEKAIGVHHAFLYIFLPSLHDYDMKMPNWKFYGGRKQATTNLFFSL